MVDEESTVNPFALAFIAPPPPPTTLVPDEIEDESGETSSSSRRRRRRGRGGSGGASAAEQAAEESQSGESREKQPQQREKRKQTPEPVTEPQKVKGSTRLEAKKQRRRDGRDAGRRRAVVTESEFLARREAVDRAMVVRSKYNRIQVAVLEDSILVEHYVAKAQEASLIGNIYLGRVQNVLPSMEAAFVDIGRGRNAVLYSGEVDWEAAQANAQAEGKQPQAKRIELALKPGDRVLVQVTKDPVGHKGARLTSQISLPGRYLVYVPNGSMSGISRKLPDTERSRLKRILKEVLPESAGVIVRTAAEGATEEQLTLDVQRLTNQWAHIQRAVETSQAPALLHSEPDLLVKIIRDIFNEDFQRLIIEGQDAYDVITQYLQAVAPDLLERVERYEGPDSFDEFRVSEQIDKALERKVWLPSGGSLVIDRTEAMTVIDVNTGKFVGAGGNLEETVTKNNLEAAEEIVRQLRLRDIGGIIVVDFIDMVLESNRDLVLRRLVECLSRDRTKHQVAEVTSLGLVQMTRKKIGLGLLETFSEPCETCAGRGLIVHHDPVVKHRAADGGARKRRGQAQTVKNGVGSAGTHAITEDVRNALARVAASTIHPEDSHLIAPKIDVKDAKAPKAQESDEAAQQAAEDAGAAASTESAQQSGWSARAAKSDKSDNADKADKAEKADKVEKSTRSTRARKSAKSAKADESAAESAAESAPQVEGASQPVAAEPEPETPKDPLAAVLEALPEPPPPGQGRSRRRRASTRTIVTPEPIED